MLLYEYCGNTVAWVGSIRAAVFLYWSVKMARSQLTFVLGQRYKSKVVYCGAFNQRQFAA